MHVNSSVDESPNNKLFPRHISPDKMSVGNHFIQKEPLLNAQPKSFLKKRTEVIRDPLPSTTDQTGLLINTTSM